MRTYLLTICTLLVVGATFPGVADEKIRVLVITGGHAFETNQFQQMFQDDREITCSFATHPAAHSHLLPESRTNYDVLVLYDMWQDISSEAKTHFVDWLKSGKGLVALHHSIVSYQAWPEYPEIVGGRFYQEPVQVDGVEKPRSVWKHDVRYTVRIADPEHPVTRGIEAFEIEDETYGLFDMLPGSHALLTTTEPSSARHIGWARTYAAGRVVYLQPGHDHHAFENPNYRRLVSQAIRWAAQAE